MKLDLALARAALLIAAGPSVTYCTANGIDPALAARHGLFLSEIQPDGRWFDPKPGGRLAAWLEIVDQDGDEIVDVAAWTLDQPDRVLTFCKAGTALGMPFAADANNYVFDSPLRVFSSPLAWLQGNCRGIVILDQARAARWLVDVRPPALEVDDWRAGSALRRAIAAATTLRIVVPPRERRAAA